MELTTFLIHLSIPIATGALVAAWSQPPLHRLLIDLCQTESRAGYWSRTICLTLILCPLFFALLWIPAHPQVSLVLTIRAALTASVCGVLFTIAVVARSINRQIRADRAAVPQGTGAAS